MQFSLVLAAFFATTALAAKTVTVTSTSTVTKKHKPCPKTTITKTRHTKSTRTVTDTETDTTTKTNTITETDTATKTETDTETDTITKTDTTTETDTTTKTETTTETDTTTTTVTSTTTPTPTNFSGKGYLYVYPSGNGNTRKGCLISGGAWYAGGGTCATYVGNTINQNQGTFNLTSSKGPCVVQASDSSINCAASNTMGSVFGQTNDGDLTYAGSSDFYAAATATGTTQQPVFATQAPVKLAITWFPLT